MPKPLKYGVPLQPKSFRLSPKHRWKLQVTAALRSRSMDDLIAEAIDHIGREVAAELGPNSWDTLWDEEEAVRMLNVYAMPVYVPRAAGGGEGNEADLLKFLFAHAQFFWSDKERTTPHRARAIILWPHRWELEKLWRTKREDKGYHVAAEKMAELLERAKLKVPAYG